MAGLRIDLTLIRGYKKRDAITNQLNVILS